MLNSLSSEPSSVIRSYSPPAYPLAKTSDRVAPLFTTSLLMVVVPVLTRQNGVFGKSGGTVAGNTAVKRNVTGKVQFAGIIDVV